MPKFYRFFYLFLLFCFCAEAQKQITDFLYSTVKGKTNFIYQATINNKILFTTLSNLKNTELWVSDGTPEKTTRLAFDDNANIISDFLFFNNQLFFFSYTNNNRQLWKTDGTSEGTVKVLEKENLYRIHVVGDKLLLEFVELNNPYASKIFAWLTEMDEIEIWEKDIVDFKIVDNKIIYSTYEVKDSIAQVKIYDKKSSLIYQQKSERLYIDNTVQDNGVNFNGFNYYVITYLSNRLLLVVSNTDYSDVKVYNFRTYNQFVPVLVKDTAQNLYIIKAKITSANDTLQVYRVKTDNTWEELSTITNLNFYDKKDALEHGWFIRNALITGNQLVFIAPHVIKSDILFNIFDFKENKMLASKHLEKDLSFETKIVYQSGETYQLVGFSKTCTYYVQQDSLACIVNMPFKIRIKDKDYEFSDNFYLLSETTKTPLLTNKDIFDNSSFFLSYQAILGNKIFLFTYNQQTHKSQIWESDGNTTKEFLDLGAGNFFEIMEFKNHIVFITRDKDISKIYKTDGTLKGTKEIYSLPDILYYKNKNKEILVYTDLQGKKLVVTDLEKTTIVEVPSFSGGYQYLNTDRTIFFLSDPYIGSIYAIDANGLKGMINNGVKFSTYKNKLYYTKYIGNSFNGLYYLDSLYEEHQIFDNSVYNYWLFGNKILVYYHFNGSFEGTILDTDTDKVVSTFSLDDYTNIRIHPYESFLVVNNTNKLVVHDGKKLNKVDFEGMIEILYINKNGCVIKAFHSGENIYDLLFYNFNTQKVSVVAEDIMRIETIVLYDDLILFETSEKYLFDIKTSKTTRLPDKSSLITYLKNGYFLLQNRENSVVKSALWVYEEQNFVRKYDLPFQSYFGFMNVDNTYYLQSYTKDIGVRLGRLDKDSIYYFPEMIKREVEVIISRVFHFQNNVYAVVYASSGGVQVWNMGKMEDKLIRNEDILATEELIETDPIRLYPVPVTNQLTIETKNPYTLQIFDSKGIEVLKSEIGIYSTINLLNLKEGTYFLKFFNEKGSLSKKIIKY